MTKQCKNFIERVETNIGNAKHNMFDGKELGKVYDSDFGETDNADNNLLPYGEDIQDHKEVEVNEVYIVALYNYIGEKYLSQVNIQYQF